METYRIDQANEALVSQEESVQIQNALVFPSVEVALDIPYYDVQMFGGEYTDAVMNALISSHSKVTLEVGMNAFIPPTPGLLAYLEMGLQRLKGLHELGCSNVGLRLFSTASLPTSNDPPQSTKRDYQRQQRGFFKQYIEMFYPDLASSIYLDDVEQKLQLPQNIDELTQELHQQSEHDLQLKQALVDVQKMGDRHGDDGGGLVTPIQYAAMHSHPNAFGYRKDKGIRVAIGCEGEVPFNIIRHASSEPNEPQPGVSLVVHKVLSKTAPYLGWKTSSKALRKSREDYPHDEPIGMDELIMLYKNCPDHWSLRDYLSVLYSKRFMQIPQIREILYLNSCVSQLPNGRKTMLDFLRQL